MTGAPITAEYAIALLKECRQSKNAERARFLHTLVCQSNLECHGLVGNYLVCALADCGLLCEAQRTFKGLTCPGEHAWTSLISGCADFGDPINAWRLYRSMQDDPQTYPSKHTYLGILRAISRLVDPELCRKVHTSLVLEGRECEQSLGNTLLDIYAKCGLLADACHVFETHPARDAVSFNSIIRAYAKCACYEDGFACVHRMQAENISPDDVTFIFALKLCSSVRSIRESQLLHADIVGRGLESKTFVGNALVDVYAKCGAHKEAHSLLFSLHTRDVVSWNALMSGYGENGCGEEVLSCLKEMEQDGILPDKTSVICGLKACGLVQKLGKGREIHLAIAKVGLDQELHVSNTLVVMYVKCGSLVDANKLVLSASKHDLVAWTVLIAGHIEKGMNIEALKCFEKMKQQGVSPDSNAYVFCLQACCDMKSVGQGQLVYLEIVKRGLNLNIFIGSALVHMYTKFGLLVDAHDVLQCLPIRNEVCWTALVSGYVEHGLCREALDCFKEMQAENISPVEFTYACILKACGILGSFEEGQYIHLDVVRKGFEVEAYVGNALVDMYVKVGHLYEAKSVFDKLPYLNVVAWTALISGYAEGELHEQVLDCFGQMQAKNINADAAILILCLKACGATISLERGREVHAEVRKSGLENDLFLANSLIDMYGKCGSPEEGQEVFNRMSVRDVVSWNALITAYGENHKGKMALQSFKRMQEQGFEPDIATFTCLLIACSHSSLIEDGQKCFELMVEKYGYEPIPQHYSTMVDLFARAGEVVKAWRFVEAMQSPPSKELLTALLTSCKNYGEGEVGERCFDLLVQLYPEDAAPYVLMSDIYASCGRWNNVHRLRELSFTKVD